MPHPTAPGVHLTAASPLRHCTDYDRWLRVAAATPTNLALRLPPLIAAQTAQTPEQHLRTALWSLSMHYATARILQIAGAHTSTLGAATAARQ